ncbi:hypothetical protein ACQYWY_09010 [Comamonas sediminis]|uniref:hypothetical protein n=1 Tax=Comamonas sediminis TaxID=1783360 RepID=UPI003D2CA572
MLASQNITINQILDRPGQRNKRTISLWMQFLAIAIALYVFFPFHACAQIEQVISRAISEIPEASVSFTGSMVGAQAGKK